MTWLASIQLSRILRWRDERRQRHRPSQRRRRRGCSSGILPLVAAIPDGGALICGRPRPRGWPSAQRGSVCLSPSCSAWSSWGSGPCSGSCRCPARAPELCWEKYVSVGKISTNPDDSDWYLFVCRQTYQIPRWEMSSHYKEGEVLPRGQFSWHFRCEASLTDRNSKHRERRYSLHMAVTVRLRDDWRLDFEQSGVCTKQLANGSFNANCYCLKCAVGFFVLLLMPFIRTHLHREH